MHNAGVAIAGAHEDIPDAEIRRVMETNFFGVLALTRALLPTFRAQRHGRIVLVSSQAAFAGQPANSIYCASKWALEGWAESIAFELDGFGIDVILVEPGPYRTEIWRSTPRILPQDSEYLPWLQQVFRGADRHEANTARDPKEVALVIADALGGKEAKISLSGRFLCALGSFSARQDPDPPHPQRHHALSGHSPDALVLVAVRAAEIGVRRVLAGFDDAAADGAGAGELLEQAPRRRRA